MFPIARPLATLILVTTSLSSWGLGTPSGQTVTNTVTVDHEISGIAQTPQSASVQFLVDNKVDLSISVTNSTVSPAQVNQAITLVIVNEGNTAQGYALSFSNSSVADDFNMNNVRIYIESNGSPGWQAGDTLYSTGNNAGDLDPNSAVPGADTLTLYLLADVPPTGGGSAPLDATAARYDVLITTLNAGTSTATPGQNAAAWTPGSVQNIFAEGTAGPHTADANNDGQLSATAVYSVNAPAVNFTKSANIVDLSGGSSASDGATITYTLLLAVSGSGSTDNVVVTDVIPTNTTYVNNSLTLNSAALSDAADADAGDFNVTTANNITVNLGNLNSSSGNQTITFAVTINP